MPDEHAPNFIPNPNARPPSLVPDDVEPVVQYTDNANVSDVTAPGALDIEDMDLPEGANYGFLDNALNNTGNFFQGVGDAFVGGAAIARGRTHIPLQFYNGSNRTIWVAVHASFSNVAPSFNSKITKAWYKITPGNTVNAGNNYNDDTFYYFAHNDRGQAYAGDTRITFTDAVGQRWTDKRFRKIRMPGNWRDLAHFQINFS